MNYCKIGVLNKLVVGMINQWLKYDKPNNFKNIVNNRWKCYANVMPKYKITVQRIVNKMLEGVHRKRVDVTQ